MNRFQFQTVPNIIAGLGTIQELSSILKQGRYQRVLLVTDPGMYSINYTYLFWKLLKMRD